MPIRSDIYKGTFKNTNKVSIIIIIKGHNVRNSYGGQKCWWKFNEVKPFVCLPEKSSNAMNVYRKHYDVDDNPALSRVDLCWTYGYKFSLADVPKSGILSPL